MCELPTARCWWSNIRIVSRKYWCPPRTRTPYVVNARHKVLQSTLSDGSSRPMNEKEATFLITRNSNIYVICWALSPAHGRSMYASLQTIDTCHALGTRSTFSPTLNICKPSKPLIFRYHTFKTSYFSERPMFHEKKRGALRVFIWHVKKKSCTKV